MSRESQLRNGSYEYGQINVNSAGFDDLLTRGNGNLWLPPNFNSYFDYQRPRKGNWGYEFELNLFSGGLSGNERSATTIHVEPQVFHQRRIQRVRGRAARLHARLAGLGVAKTSSAAIASAQTNFDRRLQLDHDQPS